MIPTLHTNARWFLIVAVAALLVLASASLTIVGAPPSSPDWTLYVRIAAWSLHSKDDAARIVREAQDSHVLGIEVDNDITGRYDSFLHPEEKLAAVRAVAEEAHKAGNHAFVYIAGLECITANADQSPHSLAKDHPDWLQRKLTGEPAIFGGGTAFWIAKGDEDVWISPYAPDWRKTYMERVRQIAATGIDGIYVDIPYWMTHFDGWENSWASFDDYTVAAFKQQTGLHAKRDLKLGDFSDPNFRKWVDFRIQTITNLMQEIDQTAKSVNPKIKTIPEIYPGIEEEAVRVGADVYSLYAVNDAIAHEYEFGGGDHMASSRTPLDWFRYQVGMASFRAFAEGKPTWILNYSWDGDKTIDPRDAMENLFMSQLMAGANVWDARGHVMSGSNDLETRKRVFAWIAAHEKTFYLPRLPVKPIGVYFSPATRNYFPMNFLRSYQGVLILLIQKHLPYEVVTPRTIAEFRGRALILPDVRLLDQAERNSLQTFAKAGSKLVITGTDTTGLPQQKNIARFATCPGKAYLQALESNFAGTSPSSQAAFLESLSANAELSIEASPAVATHIAKVGGKLHVYFANFKGLRGGENARQEPEASVRIIVKDGGKVNAGDKAKFLPFLGEEQELHGERKGNATVYQLPPILRGGVFWIE
jgi:glycosyl hydrolase family 10